MNNYQAIVFDLGGVLIDWNPDYVFRDYFGNPEQMTWFYRNICTPDWNEEQDAGRTLQEGTDLLLAKFPEYEVPIRMYYDRWMDMLGGPIAGTVDILRHLRQETSLRLYALTNWSHETFPVALKRFDFLHWFDGRIVSGEEKTRKPYPVIYRTLVDRFRIEPERSIYVDDNQRNLEPAREMGFTAIHFRNPDQFRADLAALGIPLSGEGINSGTSAKDLISD
jgi:2-haloacid dehalogenase